MLSFPSHRESDFKPVDGGVLVQEKPLSFRSLAWDKNWQIIGPPPDEKTKQDLLFALRASAHLKSNGIAIVKKGQNPWFGHGTGQSGGFCSAGFKKAKTVSSQGKPLSCVGQ